MTTYRRALDLSIEAARAAGAILRDELHRPRGPRGGRGKAPADTEAERAIRALLEPAFPEYGVLAEELLGQNRRARDPDNHVWVVDPNDGTSAFLRGHRGPAVSIALVRAGEPILGVVFAYAAPDDDGDLFAWAEGCGPMTRNGAPVKRGPWAGELGRDEIVLLSVWADGTPVSSERNVALVAPARYRPIPGIAWRLALVAAGEGDAAISVAAPGAWDYAGGHALVKAMGGVLVDEAGREVTYGVDGRSQVSRCAAGSLTMAREVVSRDWSQVLGLNWTKPDPPDLSWPRPGFSHAGADVLRRAQGCLLGQLAGDALGSLVEFRSPASILADYPDGVRELADGGTFDTLAGQPTDDSELALMLARSLVHQQCFDATHVLNNYRYWYHSRPFDIGNTTSSALGRGAKSESSQANGALMRVSPLAIYGAHAHTADLDLWARDDAALTHPHPVCLEASAVFVVAIAHAIRTGAGPREVYDVAVAHADAGGDVHQWLLEAAEGPPFDMLDHMGWVRLALTNAFWQLLTDRGVEDALVDTVGRGGDTDTNAAIAGALLGAVHGRDSVPLRWRQRVLTCRPLAGGPGVRRPRPRALWPVDALFLAERLLAVAPGA